ncbi:serine hydrolase domain-containing protein [Stenotrophomonas sp. Iso1]|uniref:serine hydrolase domain-containing protein n=1 Tax=Stenotrophomonas sp. Iso1 TaxID=2977283 RepID=UPI0022B7854C|nr:serine hydrolase domain-containing protein [Stenotrophomonas sp. Iso1]
MSRDPESQPDDDAWCPILDLDFRLPNIAASVMKKWVVGLLLLSVLMLPSVGRSAEASPQGIHAAVLDDYLDQVEDDSGGLGSVSIFRGGREVYQRRFGQKYLPGVRADADTRYQIASVTKMVTAILAFKLIEQGRLGLDDTLADFHPDMPAAAQISVRQMLAHSSGLGNFAIKDGTVWIVDALEPPAILAEIRRQ